MTGVKTCLRKILSGSKKSYKTLKQFHLRILVISTQDMEPKDKPPHGIGPDGQCTDCDPQTQRRTAQGGQNSDPSSADTNNTCRKSSNRQTTEGRSADRDRPDCDISDRKDAFCDSGPARIRIGSPCYMDQRPAQKRLGRFIFGTVKSFLHL